MTNHKRLLELALRGLESERKRINQEMADLQQQLGNGAKPQETKSRSRRRKISAAHRKAISEAMKRRWATRMKTAERSK